MGLLKLVRLYLLLLRVKDLLLLVPDSKAAVVSWELSSKYGKVRLPKLKGEVVGCRGKRGNYIIGMADL